MTEKEKRKAKAHEYANPRTKVIKTYSRLFDAFEAGYISASGEKSPQEKISTIKKSSMTVKELVDILGKFDSSLPVTFSDYDEGAEEQIFNSPNGVEKLITDDNKEVVVIFKSTVF